MNLDRIIAVSTSKIVYKDGPDAVKVFDGDYSKADVLCEAVNQARMEDAGLCVPKIKEVKMLDGKWVIVSEYIQGDTLEQLMEKNKERYVEYLELFVQLQLNVYKTKPAMLNNLKDKLNLRIGQTDLESTFRYELSARLNEMQRHNEICHGDFNPSNIIVTEDEKAYVLDWADATLGSSAADAANTYLWFYLSSGLDCAQRYLDLFCGKCEFTKKSIQRWLPIVAASLLNKSNTKDKAVLMSFVNFVDRNEEEDK